MKLLIADDSPASLRLLRAGFESAGHQVVEAANGIQALAVLAREPVDAVITDVLMPSMDGFRLCLEIRRSTAAFSEVPVILYTATYNTPSDRVLAQTVGADAYVLKPSPVSTLIDAVEQVLLNHVPRMRIEQPPIDESYVLEQYNAALVHKLETRNGEVQQSLARLQSAHEHIVQLNELLEGRVVQRTAALDAANKELEAFSFTVSHDLRAPLRRITGFAQLLAEAASTKLDAENLEFLSQIVHGAAQMDHLIEALLEFAHTTRTEMHFGQVDLEQIVDQALALLEGDLKGRNIEWRRGPLPTVRGDTTLLRQVIVNLLANAIKYTRTREHAVIEIGSRHVGEREAAIFVRDNGVGFDMRYASKLFGVFQRMHRAEEFEGIGIGLANAQRIVTRHGGSIWAEAEEGIGATFFVSLPTASED